MKITIREETGPAIGVSRKLTNVLEIVAYSLSAVTSMHEIVLQPHSQSPGHSHRGIGATDLAGWFE